MKRNKRKNNIGENNSNIINETIGENTFDDTYNQHQQPQQQPQQPNVYNNDKQLKSQHGHHKVLHRIIRRMKNVLTCRCFRSSKDIDYGDRKKDNTIRSSSDTRQKEIEMNQQNINSTPQQQQPHDVVIPTAKNIKYQNDRADSQAYLTSLNQVEKKYQREKRLSNGHPTNDISLQYAIELSHSVEHDTRAKSIPILLELLKDDSNNKNLLLNLGTSYAKDEKYLLALECAERILKLDPMDGEGLSLKYLALNGIDYQNDVEVNKHNANAPKLSPSLRHQIVEEEAISISNKHINNKNDDDDDDDETSTSTASH